MDIVSILIACFLLSQLAWAGPTAPRSSNLSALTAKSDLILVGWPSPHRVAAACGEPFAFWQINYIIKGDPRLRHQVIPIYAHGEEIQKEQRSTILFLKKAGPCWELTGPGAQEELAKESLVRSLSAPTDCRAQTEAIRVILNTLPETCASDDDCQAIKLHPRKCEMPRALNVKAAAELPPEWSALTARASTACASQWREERVCGPERTDAYCKAGRCRLGMVPPAHASFQIATLTESCAPHDAGSMLLVFTNGPEGSYPRLSVNWWGPSQPSRKPGTYTTSENFSSSYCRTEKSCTMITKIHVKVRVDGAGAGEAQAEGMTFDGAPIETKARLKLLPKQSGMRCG